MVTIHDVAQRAGVSVATVSNFLNWPDRLSPATAVKVRDAVEHLGFVPNLPARQLRRRRSGIIGLSVINAANPFFGEMVTAVELAAEDADLAVVVGSTHESPAQQTKFLDMFEQFRFDGVIVTPFDDDLGPLRKRRSRGAPVVLVDHEDPENGLSTVSLDHREGGRLATRHLVESGRRRLLFASGSAGVRQVRQRLEGCREVVDAAGGVRLDVVESVDLDIGVGEEVGRSVVAMAPAERPDAVFAGNDLHAIGLVRALQRGGLDVPRDIAVVGYDDIPFAAVSAVPLTTVRQPSREIGAAAAALLLREIADPARDVEQVVFTPELVVRASTTGGV
ncbi:LacI family DNA-binding transcriptional regulator [Oerskovia flava]|uniref:LacI family DNA-binding transcriptional regulator n=1 Tax=Oerskovia flava TaxID=2986422 RepID=UPI00224034AA|nr:LacI family DNA-binding transcriptional regulator [Oerskovia sp. JB1-3-2]